MTGVTGYRYVFPFQQHSEGLRAKMEPKTTLEISNDEELTKLLSSGERPGEEGQGPSLHPADELTLQLDAISHVLRSEESKEDLGDLEYEFIKSTLGLTQPEPEAFEDTVGQLELDPSIRELETGTQPIYFHPETYSVPLSSSGPSNIAPQTKNRSSNNLRSLADTFPRTLSSNRLSSAFSSKQRSFQSSNNLLHIGMYADPTRSQYKDMQKSYSGGSINMFRSDDAWEKNLQMPLAKSAGGGKQWPQQHRTPFDHFKEDGFYFWYQYGGRAIKMILVMLSLSFLVFLSIFTLFILGSLVIGPPSQPVGPYRLIDVQVRFYFSSKM